MKTKPAAPGPAPTLEQTSALPSQAFAQLNVSGTAQAMSVAKGSLLPSLIGQRFTAEAIDENNLQYPVHLHSFDFTSIRRYLEVTAGAKRLDALAQQLDSLKGIESEHLVKIYGYQISSVSLHIVTEPVAGPLTDLLAFCQHLPEDKILALTTQVVDALSSLHDAGLLHKSLSPDHIHLASSDVSQVKLAGASYVQELVNINRSTRFEVPKERWVAPEEWSVNFPSLDSR